MLGRKTGHRLHVHGDADTWNISVQVSLAHWNQDEEYGGFGGPHCMVVGGYGAILTGLAENLDIRFNMAVTSVAEKGDDITVTTADGGSLQCAFRSHMLKNQCEHRCLAMPT